MNFSFKDCLKNALIKAIGSKPDFEIILAAVKWVEKGVLVEADVEEIQAAIDKQYSTKTISEMETVEETADNVEM